MLIDPFTVLAQIVNFLILVALLKHFLYGPITRAMAQRQQTIAEQLEQAAQQERIAQQETERLQQMQQQFAAHREQRLTQLRSHLAEQRLTLLEQVEDEVETARSRWLRALEQEKTTVLRSFRQQIAYQLSQTVRQVLHDLANADLEQQVLATFLNRLQQLPHSEQQVLQSALRQAEGAHITIRSSFALEEVGKTTLADILQTVGWSATWPQRPTLQFDHDPALGCGIELIAPGYKLAWNFATYLDTLERNLALTFAQHPLDSPLDAEPVIPPA